MSRATSISFTAATLLLWFGSGCGQEGHGADENREGADDGATERSAPPPSVPPSVEISGGKMISGFSRGVLRRQVEVPAYRITQHPITRKQYDQCVEAGACQESKRDGCAPPAYEQLRGRKLDAAKSPLTCARVSEATSYCRWVGGRLPTMSEWLLAARGPNPQRHAWGEHAPTCEQHPRAADTPGAFANEAAALEAGCEPALEAKLVVGEHESGAAASGMQDVLLTPGELLAQHEDAQFSGCGKGFEGCFVYGHSAGEIDAVYPLGMQGASAEQAHSPHVYGFRCVLEQN
jgi:hypothetical protein